MTDRKDNRLSLMRTRWRVEKNTLGEGQAHVGRLFTQRRTDYALMGCYDLNRWRDGFSRLLVEAL